MQFTVIIPAYNAAAFIQEAIDSVMSQKYQSWELIVVDDGSRDDTKRIAEGFAAADPRVRLISKKNAGVSAARNDGLVCACGDYVFFLDADDRLEENVMHSYFFGAGDGARTRYLHLGKVALYQMSYTRIMVPPVGVEPTTRGFSVRCSTY